MTATAKILSTSKSRWYAPTPAKFLFAMLLMQGILFLSAHYRWFWFNERKGYTVLITFAATAAALILLVSLVLISRFFKSKSQFGLATLLLMVPVMAIPCGWLAREMELARRQRDLGQMIERNRGALVVLHTGPIWPFAVNAFGKEFFADIEEVQVTDGSQPIDFALSSVESLQTVLLYTTGITNESLSQFKKTPYVRRLYVFDTDDQVNDEGLINLQELTKLEELMFDSAAVTDAGLINVRQLTRLRLLSIQGAQVTDAGLEHLHGLTNLRTLYLAGTQVTDAGVRELQEALPDCKISWWRRP